MHRCLNILEIADMICALLDPRISSVSGPTPYRHLASVARTCTALQGPALDHLWSSTALSKILIRCMPSDLWAIATVDGKWSKEQAILLLRPVRDLDWNRVHLYAPRVKTLSSGNGWSLHGIFPALSMALPDALFPNLQTLDWGDYDEDFHYIHLFLHPTLTTIKCSPSSDSDSSLLSTLMAKCPRLTNITVSTLLSPGVLVSEFVRKLQCAEHISVTIVDAAALQHVSHLNTLKSLTLHTLPNTLQLPPVGRKATFPVLRQFSVDDTEVGPTTQVLRWCSGVPLDTFNVAFYEPLTAKEMRGLVTAMSTAFLHSSLTDLCIGNSCDDLNIDPDVYLNPFQSLRHVFIFANLVSLTIASPLGFDLDDEAVLELAKAWPRITVLRLGVRCSARTPRTTLSCLHSFAQNCPRLQILGMLLNATAVPICTTSLAQRSLHTLEVDHSSLAADPVSVARFLSGMFPEMTDIETFREYYDNDDEDDLMFDDEDVRLHNQWKEVQELLDGNQ
ncbi:hypothetical protein C8F04DRAFT_277581 [Mycena alexandri]|uniref:F-box domain-containing protein n=1 Tax=Mycena alexandri TaxID=1745969 RepID=A0AAD6S4T8_9AGAR|nr:hypothetical protein C8F04DRAFT_277581 [Mycena alexandri]